MSSSTTKKNYNSQTTYVLPYQRICESNLETTDFKKHNKTFSILIPWTSTWPDFLDQATAAVAAFTRRSRMGYLSWHRTCKSFTVMTSNQFLVSWALFLKEVAHSIQLESHGRTFK